MSIGAEATRDASRVLDQAWSTVFGVDVPVDPISIAQSLGIGVYLSSLPDGVAGLLVKRGNQDPEIHLNAADSENRQRFTCAHELGHYIRRAGKDDDVWEYIDKRDQLSTLGTDPEERYANAFAAQLLMPEHEIRGASKRQSPAQMALTFHVSLEAINNRLTTLRLTDG